MQILGADGRVAFARSAQLRSWMSAYGTKQALEKKCEAFAQTKTLTYIEDGATYKSVCF